jgi:aspartate racemase
MIGILGGMGPAATVELMRQIICLTPADNDAQHVPVIVSSDPRVPGLGDAILRGGKSPIDALIRRIQILETAGAKCIAIPCHAAHHWYDQMSRATRLPILHIADAVCDMLSASVSVGTPVGLMAAEATLESGFYAEKLATKGYLCTTLSHAQNERLVFPAIKLVKKGDLRAAASLFRDAIRELHITGAKVVVFACTEIPVALNSDQATVDQTCIDGTEALAQACVDWWLGRHAGKPQ